MIVYYTNDRGMTFRMGPEDHPVAIILTEHDKLNIARMSPHATIYCQYPDHSDAESIRKWLKEVKELESEHHPTEIL